MSLAISLKSEFLKTKRSYTWLFTFIMAAIAPILVLLIFEYDLENEDQTKRVITDPWNFYFYQGWGMVTIVLLPMFVVLISTLLPQIEYRNHTWKQVLAAPQSFGKLFLSKFLILQLFIFAFLIIESLLMGVSCVISNTLYPQFNFYAHSFDLIKYLDLLWKSYVAILGLVAFQFCLGLRFKTFLLPIGVAALLGIFGILNLVGFHVIPAENYPVSYSALIAFKQNAAKIPFALWSSVICAIVIMLIGFFDFSRVRER